MVVEALAAVALAGNIAQFLGILTRLIRGTHEIYTSINGSTKANAQRDEILDYISTLSTQLESDISTKLDPSQEERNLMGVAKRSKDEAHRFRLELSKIRLNPGQSKTGSFVQALKCVWKSKEFDDLEASVNVCRKLLADQLISLIR